MEEAANHVAFYLSLSTEVLAALIIGVALLRFIIGYLPKLFHKKQYIHNAFLRVEFGSALAVALELLLAADILQTAIAPTWDEVGKLAAIAAIRTALNYFLERELRHMEERVATE